MSMMGVMMGWMRADPEGAFSWVQNNGDELSGASAMGMSKESFEAMYYAGLAKKDFQGTMAKFGSMSKKVQKAVLGNLTQSAATDIEKRDKLLSFVESQQDKKLLEETRKNIVSQMSWQDPEGALRFIKEQKLENAETKELEKNAISMWSYSDPQSALEWQSEKLVGEENAGDEISNTFGQWLSRDYEGASEWLAEQPEEFLTDDIFSNAGRQLMNEQSHEQASEWYAQVFDDESRKLQYETLYETWSSEDQEAADAWLEGLPEEDRPKKSAKNL